MLPPEDVFGRPRRTRSWPLPRPPPISEIVRDPRNAPPKPRRYQYSSVIPALSVHAELLTADLPHHPVGGASTDVVDSAACNCSSDALRPPAGSVKIRKPVSRSNVIRRRSKSVATLGPFGVHAALIASRNANFQLQIMTAMPVAERGIMEESIYDNYAGSHEGIRQNSLEPDKQRQHSSTTCLDKLTAHERLDSVSVRSSSPAQSSRSADRHSRGFPSSIFYTNHTTEPSPMKKRGSIKKLLSKFNMSIRDKDGVSPTNAVAVTVPPSSVVSPAESVRQFSSLSIGDPVLTSDTRGKDVDWINYIQELNGGRTDSPSPSVRSEILRGSEGSGPSLRFRRNNASRRDREPCLTPTNPKSLERCGLSRLSSLFVKMSHLKQ